MTVLVEAIVPDDHLYACGSNTRTSRYISDYGEDPERKRYDSATGAANCASYNRA